LNSEIEHSERKLKMKAAQKIFDVEIAIMIVFGLLAFPYPMVDSGVYLKNNVNVVNGTTTPHIPLERCVIPGVVAITFDDGPYYRTLKVLEVLREKNVTATFFINGANYLDIGNTNATAIVQRTIDDGHLIASHTWTHQNLTDGLSFERIEHELNELSDNLLRIFGRRPTAMRPPFGEFNDTVIDIVGGYLGYEIITWSIDTKDWSHPNDTQAGLAGYINKLNGTDPATTPGFIALHHDPIPHSDELAAIAIDYVRKMGYRFASLSECLGIRIK